jgi:excisionase family DNA binding protein
MHTTDRDGEERRVGDGSHDRHDQGATVAEAARLLGITEGAVRKRVERGKLRAEHDPAGRLIVYPEGGAGATSTTSATRDQPRRSRDDRYTRSLEEQVEYLRRQLERRDEELREHRRLLAGLIERVPELPPATTEARESPESSGPTPTPTEASAPQETPAQRRPWWRRIFGP